MEYKLHFKEMGGHLNRLRVRPVQARAVQTVEHILATAARLLDEVGVDRFNTNLLAERADVRVRTVYRYFADKHAVILCLAVRMYERADDSFRRTLPRLADPTQPWRPALGEVFDDYFRTMAAAPGWAAIRRALQAVPGLDELRVRTVSRHTTWLADALCARGLDLPRARIEVIAATAFASGSAVLEPALKGGAHRRKAVARELKLMVSSYFAHYLD